jgi:hypothetical protein
LTQAYLKVARVGAPPGLPPLDGNMTTNQAISLSGLRAGRYLAEVLHKKRVVAQRVFTIIAWEELDAKLPEELFSIWLGGATCRGALIEPISPGA